MGVMQAQAAPKHPLATGESAPKIDPEITAHAKSVNSFVLHIEVFIVLYLLSEDWRSES
jgi:hypothetical protein